MNFMRNNILVTGSAGFIGFSLCKKLIEDGYKVIGVDNINDYYDTKLKKRRLEILSQKSFERKNWQFLKIDLINKDLLLEIFEKYKTRKTRCNHNELPNNRVPGN